MKALIYQGPLQRTWEDHSDPKIQEATDAIVHMSTSTICGTDLHIMNGEVPTVEPGRILGHEGVGIIKEIGADVTNFKKGDRVLISCITSCGKCDFCKKQMYSHCRNGGWALGNTIDGTQAEYVRIPHADHSLYLAPQEIEDDTLVLLSDIFPTGFECGVLNGQVKPGDIVTIIGAGPIGLSALLTSHFYSPTQVILVDCDTNRLQVALELGATCIINYEEEDVIERILALTYGSGVDVAMDAVGTTASFATCQSIITPGGRIANIGVHGKPVELHLEKLWHYNVTITTRLVDTFSTSLLLKLLRAGKLEASKMITHRFPLGEVMKAYDVFSNAAKEKAIKVILKA